MTSYLTPAGTRRPARSGQRTCDWCATTRRVRWVTATLDDGRLFDMQACDDCATVVGAVQLDPVTRAEHDRAQAATRHEQLIAYCERLLDGGNR